MSELETTELLKKYCEGTLSPEEGARLETWYIDYAIKSENQLSAEQVGQSLNRMRGELPLKYGKTVKPLWSVIAVAASVLVALAVGIWFFNTSADTQFMAGKFYANDIAPGKNSATLTLANGKVISLSDTKSGVVFAADKLTYNDGSEIVAQNPGAEGGIQLVTASTPRGGQYQVVLPDGTKVWLNAASSIKFPSTFADLNTRDIFLKGEAYFEVSKSFKNGNLQPFIVRTDKQQVQVLGTHFNISSYGDENDTKTTLLEGSIRLSPIIVNKVIRNVVLKPNEQATLSNAKMEIKVVDPELAIAWKNNKFMFESERIENVMKMVERWYNVEVVYEGEMPNDKFGGSVSRFDKVSKVLSILELTGNVHFKIEGRRIIVTK